MRKWTGFFIACCLVKAPAYAIGLSMRFVDVTLEYVEPGAVVNLRAAKNLPLVVINKDEEDPADVMVEALVPDAKELKEGYEPIPDPTWLHSVPDHFHLGPKASGSADVILQIPNDPKLIGHHYEAILWVHTVPKNRLTQEGGVLFQVALRSRFRLSIGTKGPAALQREKALKKLATINANFTVNPDTLFVQACPVGKTIDFKTDKKSSLKIVNQSDDPIDLKIQATPSDPNISPQAGYEYAPDPHWMDISPTKIHIAGNSIKELKIRLTIPDKPIYRNKKYMFLVQTTLSDDSLPLVYYNTIYITTEP